MNAKRSLTIYRVLNSVKFQRDRSTSIEYRFINH